MTEFSHEWLIPGHLFEDRGFKTISSLFILYFFDITFPFDIYTTMKIDFDQKSVKKKIILAKKINHNKSKLKLNYFKES